MELGFDFWYTLALLAVMAVFLVKEWLAIEITIFSVLLLLMIGKIITVKEAFSGFSNEGTLSIALLFLIAGALNNSGIISRLSDSLFGVKRQGISRKLLRILFPVAGISAFMNNTPIVAMMIPATRSWAEKHQVAASKFLMPISFAAILGGMCTLIGTSTNLVIHGLMIDYGIDGLSFFEISKIGVPAAIAGVLFMVIFGRKLLPNNKEHLVELGEHTREFVIELKVHREYPGIGKTIEDAGLRHLAGVFLFQIERNGTIIAPAKPDEKILLDDRLFFTGIPKTILDLQLTPGLKLTRDSHFDLKQYDSSTIKTFECTISPGSPLVAKTVRDSNFRRTYSAVIIAIHRHGERIQKKIGDIVLRPGDTLLLLAKKNFRQKWYYSKDFYLIAGTEEVPSKPRWQANLAIGVFAGMVLLTVFKALPFISAAGIGVILLLGSQTINRSEVREMIDWRVLAIIAISLGIAAAVKNSGVAVIIAQTIVYHCRSLGVIGVLSALYIFTSCCNLIITRYAAAALMFPIAVSVAAEINADARAFIIAVALAAAASFATPISSPTNMMVYGAGGYNFKDFLKIGVPLQIIVGLFVLTLIYIVYL